MGLVAPAYGQDEPSQARVAPSTLPTPRLNNQAPLEAFGGGAPLQQRIRSADQIGDALGDVSQRAVHVGLEERYQANHAVVLDTNLQAEKIKDDMQQSFMGLHGPDAVKAQPEYEQQFQKKLSDLSANLTPPQQEMFNGLAASHQADLNHVMRSHAVQETQKFQKDVSQATVENFQTDAARNAFDPSRIDESKDLALNEMTNYLGTQGIHPSGDTSELYKNNALDVTDKLHMGVINARLSAGAPQAAANYFDLHKDEINPDNFNKVESSLKDGKLRSQSQGIVDGLTAKYSDYAAAAGDIRNIQDPDLRDAVEQRAEREFALKQKTLGQANDDMMLKWSDAVQKNGTTDVVPPQVFSQMTGDQQKALGLLATQSVSLQGAKPDDAVYTKYAGMPPGQLAKVSPAEMLTQVKPYLNQDQYQSIAGAWEQSRDTTNPDSINKVKSMYNDKQLVFNAMQDAKVLPSSVTLGTVHKNEEQATMYRQFSEKADNAFQAFTQDNGRQPNDSEKTKIIDGLLIKKVFVPHFFGDQQKPVNVLTDEEKGSAYVKMSDIPPAHVSNMQARAARLGNQNLSKDQMQRAYAAALGHDDQGVDNILSGK